jgi:hypothetical protein
VNSSSRIALACTSLCLAVSTTGAQSVRQCPLSERQAAFARPVVATGFVAGNVELWHYFKQAWWSGEKAPRFFFRSDWDEDFRDQWLKPTISYSQSAAMRNRANFTGPSELRRSLDYSGQTSWFSADIRQLLGSRAPRYWPSLLRLSAGHSITDYVDPITGASHYHFPSPALQLTPGVRGISWYR